MANNNASENCIQSNSNRKLSELRVFELRSELQKRNQDSNGVKAVLVSRLSDVLQKEGHNPEEYIFIMESKKNVGRRTGTPSGKTSAKEETDSDIDAQEMNDSLNENDISIDESYDKTEESFDGKTGYEASDIIEDALQLAVDDELKEEREDLINEDKKFLKINSNSSRNEVNNEKHDDEDDARDSGLCSPPKPETAPVVAPLTVEDIINLESSKQKKSSTDDTSLIVNVDDTQSDLADTDLDGSVSNVSTHDNEDNSQETKNENKSSNKKTNNEQNNSNDSKHGSNDNNSNNDTNTEASNNVNSSKDSEVKDSSKSKSSNASKDNKSKSKDSKNAISGQKLSQNSSVGRNIWVSGLSQTTKASELQSIFSKHGKVISAKIIKNARMSGSRCFGFITMENSEQVTKCITQLNKTELHGRDISLSRNRPQENATKTAAARKLTLSKQHSNAKKSSTKSSDNKKESTKENGSKESTKETKSDDKSEDNNKSKNSGEKEQNKKKSESREKSETKDRRKSTFRPTFRDRSATFRRPAVPFRRPVPFRKPFGQNTGPSFRGFRRNAFSRGGHRGGMRAIEPLRRGDVDRNIRERERERQLRDERRRREELFRKDVEKMERLRFEREKEKLKFERMKLEREKVELLRFERERARLEREKIEREREEIRRRQQTQIPIHHRDDEPRSRTTIVSSTINTKRPFDSREPYWEERKRIQQVPRMEPQILPARQYIESSSGAPNRHIAHGYEARNESYKRGRMDMTLPASTRSDFDNRRHDSRHASGHDRDERKSGSGPSAGSYYRDSSRGSFSSRDRRVTSQREEWKPTHDSRRDRYSDKTLSGGSSAGFGGTSRSYGSDSRGWSDRNSNSINKVSYGGNVHLSSGQAWNSSSDRWTPAIGTSAESRNRGQPNLNASMLTGNNPSIAELFGTNPISGMGLNISHSLGGSGGSNINAGDRPYLHSNRRF